MAAMKGLRMFVTSDVTTVPNAAPMTTATAKSTTLPRSRNFLKPLNIVVPPGEGRLAPEWPHVNQQKPLRNRPQKSVEHRQDRCPPSPSRLPSQVCLSLFLFSRRGSERLVTRNPRCRDRGLLCDCGLGLQRSARGIGDCFPERRQIFA